MSDETFDSKEQLKFFRISGDAEVEMTKTRILRMLCTRSDLEHTLSLINEILQALDGAKYSPLVLQALTSAAVISYCRCFNSKFSYPLKSSIFDNTAPATSHVPGQISEKNFHKLIINYRNKHIAHSDDFLKAGDVGACIQMGNYFVAPLLASRVTIEDRSFYESFGRLSEKAHRIASERFNHALKSLVDLLYSGVAVIGEEPSQVTPIPLDSDPISFWGLSY